MEVEWGIEVVASSYGSRATEARGENKDMVLWSIGNLRQKGQSVKVGGGFHEGREDFITHTCLV